MAGIILLGAMVAGAISLWLKRRRSKDTEGIEYNDESDPSTI